MNHDLHIGFIDEEIKEKITKGFAFKTFAHLYMEKGVSDTSASDRIPCL